MPCTLPIVTFGSDEQKGRFVPPLARGVGLGAFALTEPEAGSDAGALRSAAVPEGGGWRIEASKQWITNGSYAPPSSSSRAPTPETTGARGVSAFLLDGDGGRGHA